MLMLLRELKCRVDFLAVSHYIANRAEDIMRKMGEDACYDCLLLDVVYNG